jgi:hypothetical protein
MTKNKSNEVVYHVLSHYLDHYIKSKKIFKTDYDSHMITVTVFTHFLYGTLNPSHKKYQHENLNWGDMYPLVKGLSKRKIYFNKSCNLFSFSRALASS